MKSNVISRFLVPILFLGLHLGMAIEGIAQNSIPNGNFETWNAVSYDYPEHYNTSNEEVMPHCGFSNATKSTDAYAGNYAVMLNTALCGNDTVFGYFLNTEPDDNFPNWPGGFALNEAPTGIQGYYKSNVISPDTARLVVIFRKNNSPVGVYVYSLYGTHNSYTAFNFTFSPALSVIPDSVIIAAASSNFYDESMARVGSTLLLDNLSFTGVTSQPVLFDGSFETWGSNTTYTPASWTNFSGEGLSRTSDRAAGMYAAELVTRLGERNGNPIAEAATLSNGDWDNACQCWTGGYPFSNTTDTLEFYYKYNGMSNDSAEVFLMFKKNGVQVHGVGKRLGSTPSLNFVKVEIPFTIPVADTAVLTVQSSLWQDSSAVYVGSKLTIDEIHFKSQPLTTFRSEPRQFNSTIYPNPLSNQAILRIDVPLQDATLTIENSYGQTVKEIHHLSGNTIQVHRDNLPSGLYYVRILNGGNIISVGKILIKD